MPPALPGLADITRLEGQSVSTALKRVWSKDRQARYKVAVRDEAALVDPVSSTARGHHHMMARELPEAPEESPTTTPAPCVPAGE
ncbi:hypothetical protein [Halomonas stenophila]|uniref:hypothetical protein n=1 Tax=Halomonas stenophila TaxID=795312 RepID=UPI003CCCAEF1